ncbi:hypothetical protein [Kitasatospora sp. NPDC056181]|uniref:hypothetical protein n=1 Tax=Kitasatospora sp. NPDC056181 TaxID=3345737 RepID=UPI0035E01179
MRRTTVLATAVAIVSLTGLVGCDDDSAPAASATAAATTASASAPASAPASASASAATDASPTASAAATAASTATTAPAAPPAATGAGGVIDPEQALALAGKTPYAATQDFRSEGGPLTAITTARVNLNGPVRSGRLTQTMSAGGEDLLGDGGTGPDVVVTDDGTTYIRSGSSWRTSPLGDRIADYHGYAKALLALGPAARKGMEDCAGTPCFHLAGTVDLEQMRTLEAEQYKILKSKNVTSFRLEQWIDAQGRTVRYDRRTELNGVAMRTHGTFKDFGPVEKVARPA